MTASKVIYWGMLTLLLPLSLSAAPRRDIVPGSERIPANAVTPATDEAIARLLLDRKTWCFDGGKEYWKIQAFCTIAKDGLPAFYFTSERFRKPCDVSKTPQYLEITGKAEALRQLETWQGEAASRGLSLVPSLPAWWFETFYLGYWVEDLENIQESLEKAAAHPRAGPVLRKRVAALREALLKVKAGLRGLVPQDGPGYLHFADRKLLGKVVADLSSLLSLARGLDDRGIAGIRGPLAQAGDELDRLARSLARVPRELRSRPPLPEISLDRFRMLSGPEKYRYLSRAEYAGSVRMLVLRETAPEFLVAHHFLGQDTLRQLREQAGKLAWKHFVRYRDPDDARAGAPRGNYGRCLFRNGRVWGWRLSFSVPIEFLEGGAVVDEEFVSVHYHYDRWGRIFFRSTESDDN